MCINQVTSLAGAIFTDDATTNSSYTTVYAKYTQLVVYSNVATVSNISMGRTVGGSIVL
jgi:hypothetical protein